MQTIGFCEHLEAEMTVEEMRAAAEKIGTDFFRPYHEGHFYVVNEICMRCFTESLLGHKISDEEAESIVEAYADAQRDSSLREKYQGPYPQVVVDPFQAPA